MVRNVCGIPIMKGEATKIGGERRGCYIRDMFNCLEIEKLTSLGQEASGRKAEVCLVRAVNGSEVGGAVWWAEGGRRVVGLKR
jgi:hypothetical protein